MKVIGITGGVGSGKTALLNNIAEKYCCKVFFADEIANYLKEPGQSCYGALVTLLGSQILDEAGLIDNKKLADMIFGNEALLELVNKVVHPAVKSYIRACIKKEKEQNRVDFIFVEAALFIEAGYRDIVDGLWYIYAGKEARMERLQEGRGYTPDKICSIMDKQLEEEAFREACDVIIDNSGKLEDTMNQVKRELETNEIM